MAGLWNSVLTDIYTGLQEMAGAGVIRTIMLRILILYWEKSCVLMSVRLPLIPFLPATLFTMTLIPLFERRFGHMVCVIPGASPLTASQVICTSEMLDRVNERKLIFNLRAAKAEKTTAGVSWKELFVTIRQPAATRVERYYRLPNMIIPWVVRSQADMFTGEQDIHK